MKLASSIFITSCALLLTACGTPDYTESAFVTPLATGDFVGELDTQISGGASDGSGNGYSYALGFYPPTGGTTSIKAIAGIWPTATVTAVPIAGTATYSGTYGVAYATGIEVVANTLIAFVNEETGNITLAADFNAGTLNGSSGGLTVIGTFNSNNLDGTVTFNGQSGILDGLIGGDATIGVFHGNNDTEIFAGGFGANVN